MSASQPRVGRHRRQDRRVHLSGEEHGHQFLAFGRALDRRRITEFGDVSFLEGHPFHAVDVHAVVVGENAPQPGRGRHGVRARADAATREISGSQRPALDVVHEVRMLEAREHHRGQEHQRFAGRLRHEEGHDRKFSAVELEVAHDALERGARRLDVGELETHEGRAQLAPLQRRGDGVVPQERAHCDGLIHGGVPCDFPARGLQ